MQVKRNNIISGRKIAVILLVFLLLGGTVLSGCSGATLKGWSGVAVGNDALFLGTRAGNLIALDASSGAQLWSVTPESTESGGFFSPPKTVAIYGTPALDEDSVYIGTYILAGGKETGRVFAFPADKIEPRWIYPAQGHLDGAIIGSTVVSQGRVYFGCSNGYVYALDARNGEKKWEFQTGAQIWGTPVLSGDTLYIGSFDNKIYALDTASGSEKWHFQADGAIVAKPLVYEGVVYAGSYSKTFYAIEADSGKMKWQFMATKGFWASALASGDIIYAPCLDGNVYICDAATGRDLGVLDLGKYISSSPVLVDNSVVVIPQEGRLYTIATSVNREVELKDLAAIVDAPLSTAGGNIYIHTGKPEKIYALNSRGAEVWPSFSLKSK
ncbi:MAG: PQQ-binding-like beta-propeller repeat protein [Chloroflexota bacterium]